MLLRRKLITENTGKRFVESDESTIESDVTLTFFFSPITQRIYQLPTQFATCRKHLNPQTLIHYKTCPGRRSVAPTPQAPKLLKANLLTSSYNTLV